MVTQHAKWMEQCTEFPWRRPIASLNVLLTSHAWRNDHNGFSHQAPGFVDNALQRRSEVVRIYYPPDANCLLIVVRSLPAQPQLRQRRYLRKAASSCNGSPSTKRWRIARRAHPSGNSRPTIGGTEPDIVLACAGDVPTIEACATSWLLQKHVPGIKVRVVNVVDLAVLMSPDDHPHGMDNISFDALFTARRRRDLRAPRLSLAHPQHGARPRERSPLSRARLQRRGQHHHAVRYGRAQQDEPLPPGH